ncbi:glycoside hydrolase family 3 C-terminal domain-containing protein [Streptomyces sp. NBC_00988]|uniref:beta-glucosidase n=1 Tax=Streptomyces sp. NBC_00988 TaxID=2903704 RepID=UPI0038676774|nr:glycoside hydrolase family 3 C-terminal domain-containing protein [Streptomyces sp. NBC_00988]
MTDHARETAVEQALGKLDLDAKARLLAGQDMWSLPALPEIGLASLVMSDGPVGVRGVRWTADDPSVALPSPTALAATWDPELARRAGHLLAQEARRKGVHVLLAPTVNLHRSPLGGRHFEAYSEDPLLTGAIGTGYVTGVQEGGVGTTVKHFVANDAETDRFTVNNLVGERALRELYLAPFETIVKNAHPWGIMAAYNCVNGTTMSEHHYLQNEVLRGEWGFDGFVVSDWMAARDTVGAINGGLDVAMPGPETVYGTALAEAVRDGRVEESVVDAAVRNVLRLAARVGVLDTVPPAVAEAARPSGIDAGALARDIACRSFVLVRNEGSVLPLPRDVGTVALIGTAAREARILGGGSAQVFPDQVVSPLDGLAAALPAGSLTYFVGADPSEELAVAGEGFALRAVCRDAEGRLIGETPLPSGQVQWLGTDLPEGVTHDTIHSVELTGTFTPRESGPHQFGTRGVGGFRLTVDGQVLFDGEKPLGPDTGPFEAFFGAPDERGSTALRAGQPVEVSLRHLVLKSTGVPIKSIVFSLMHQDPRRDADELITEAVEAARAADTAIVVVATTERVESEGFDRKDMRLPGRQDDLVRAVAAVNPQTVVVVNSGSPVELPWREDVAAVLLSWFPGQEAGNALADVLLGAREPGGRLPTTWPVRLRDAPVSRVVPDKGELRYEEGVLIGYRAWEREDVPAPAYAFGHGLGYTDWTYESLELVGRTARVRVRNTGARPGREVVQVYVAPLAPAGIERPARQLAGFTSAEAGPGETAEVMVQLPERAFQVWDDAAGCWAVAGGEYSVEAGRSVTDRRVGARTTV